MQNARLINFTALLLMLFLMGYIVSIGRAIILPFIVALVIWYIIIAVAESLKKIPFTQFQLPNFIRILLALVLTYLVLHFIIVLVTNTVIELVNEAPRFQAKLEWVINLINREFDLNYNISTLLAKISFSTVFTNVTLALTNLAQNFFLILIYVLFLLLEYQTFKYKLRAIIKDEKNYQRTHGLIEDIKAKINTYIRLKTVISFATAFISYIAMVVFQVKNPMFWALLIFLLNFIPTIGSIIAVGLTLLVVSLEFSSLYVYLGLAASLIVIQFVMGNIIEPKFTGSGLNLSPVVILLSLAFWGSLLGVIGMFLCVPLMTIANIILMNFDKTRPIAILLSARYEIL